MAKKESARVVGALENCLSDSSIGSAEHKNIDNTLENQSIRENSWLAGCYANIDFMRLNQVVGGIDNGSPTGKEHVKW